VSGERGGGRGRLLDPSLFVGQWSGFAGGGLFWQCLFATTIYTGHPGWKAMGARSAYSTINGVVILLLCCCGGLTLVMKVIPIEVTFGILLWIGLIIMAQCF